MNLWESVNELICFCERVDFVHLYAQRKLIFVQKLFQSASDVLRICAYMYNNVTWKFLPVWKIWRVYW